MSIRHKGWVHIEGKQYYSEQRGAGEIHKWVEKCDLEIWVNASKWSENNSGLSIKGMLVLERCSWKGTIILSIICQGYWLRTEDQ